MKRWVMFSLVILASLITGIGYYYYNYIYVSPNELKEMAIGADTMAYNELMEKIGARLSEGEFTYRVVVNPAGGGKAPCFCSATATHLRRGSGPVL